MKQFKVELTDQKLCKISIEAVIVFCGFFAEPSWAVGALSVVSVCIVLSCVVCVWKKRLIKKEKDKEKDKKMENEKSKGGFDTEMDGGHDVVSNHTHRHTHIHLLQTHCPCNVSLSWHVGHPEPVKLSVIVETNV